MTKDPELIVKSIDYVRSTLKSRIKSNKYEFVEPELIEINNVLNTAKKTFVNYHKEQSESASELKIQVK